MSQSFLWETNNDPFSGNGEPGVSGWWVYVINRPRVTASRST